MGVRFVIGRAGTGKTHGCVTEIAAAMRALPLGPPLYWIVPDQATFIMERLLVAQGLGGAGGDSTGGGGGFGTFRAQVVSFERLAKILARQVGWQVAPAMNDLARRILLEELIRKNRDQLALFGPVAQRPGFLQKLDGTLSELRQHGHSGATLREIAGHARVCGDGILAGKLHDLALLLDAWNGRVETREISDRQQLLRVITEKLAEVPGIGAAQIWVDGFSSFTGLELRMLAGLGVHARRVTLTLLADPDSPSLLNLRAEEAMPPFARTESLHRRIIDVFRRRGVNIEGTTALRERRRFVADDLRRVEAELFFSNGGGNHGEHGGHGGVGDEKGTVELWECSDPETEVRIVAQWIKSAITAVAPNVTRYRHIGLIVPNLEAYQDAIRRIFSEHRIPHFIDQRRSIAHHPLVELLRSAVAIAANRWDREDVLLYLKTNLAGITEEQTAQIENYLLAHAITRTPWSERWEWIAPNQKDDDEQSQRPARPHEIELLVQVNGARAKIEADLRGWMRVADSPEAAADAAGYVRGLRALLVRLGVEARMEALVQSATQQNDPELGQTHEQVWRQIQEVLGLLENILAGTPRTLREFEQLLGTALEGLTLGLIPPTVDQVIVSTPLRSRTPEITTAIVLGAVEGDFPKVDPEDPILSDAQRTIFNELTADPIVGGSDRKLLEMPFFDYVTLTRASERLIVSWPLADRQGHALRRSQYITRLRVLLGEERVVEQRFDALSPLSIDRLATVSDLLSGVVSWARATLTRRQEQLAGAGNDPRMRAVYDWLMVNHDAELGAARVKVWEALAEVPAPALSQQSAGALFPATGELYLSVSQLEKFAQCPLEYFFHYTLRLQPREELRLDTLNLGILYHRILERVYLRIIRKEFVWPDGGPEQLRAVIAEEVEAAGREIHAELAQRTPGYDKMQRRAARVLGTLLEADRRRAMAGELRPMGVEVPYGRTYQREGQRLVSLPVLRLSTPAGRTVALHGKIDRIDADAGHAAVIDYKSASDKRLNWSWIYAGLSLQLATYALVMRDLAKVEPAAALYLALSMKRLSAPRREETIAPGTDEFFQQFKPRGMIDASAIASLDSDIDPSDGVKSAWFPYSRNKKDCSVGKSSDAFEHGDFEALLGFVRHKLAVMADDVMAGRIAPDPYREGVHAACEYCEFQTACPFDQARGHFRALEKVDKAELIARAAEVRR